MLHNLLVHQLVAWHNVRMGESGEGGSESPLDEMLCFSLYTAARATNRLYLTLLAPYGLTYPQYLVLRLLWARGSATVGEVAHSLMLDPGTTSPLVRRLESRGLAQRKRSSRDERVVTVDLTDAGRALEKEMCDLTSQVGTATGLEMEQAMSTIEVLHTLRTNTDSATASLPRTH